MRMCLAVIILAVVAVDLYALHRLFLFRRPIVQPCPLVVTSPVLGIPDRNLVNLTERNLPAEWDGDKNKNIKWSTRLGQTTFGQPIIADGRVFVSTNGLSNPHLPKMPNFHFRGMLMAFRESDGLPLWYHVHEHPPTNYSWWAYMGLPSSPTVDGSFLYYITPSGKVLCAESESGRVRWTFDMAKELGISLSPGSFWSTPPYAAPLIIGDLVYVVTGNGRNEDDKLVAPMAPSFLALHKDTGKIAWHSNLPLENIIESNWSSAVYANAGGIPQVIFPGGDGVLYSFEPKTGKLRWQCDCLPKRQPKNAREIDLYFVGSPVVVDDRLYVGLGVTGMHARTPRFSWFLCLDITKRGNVSLKSYDASDPGNKGSALVWAFGGPILPSPAKGRQVYFGSTVSTPAVHEGLVYIPEEAGYLHCLDARTGNRYWEHDFRAGVWGSPFLADGKVYVGTDDGEAIVFGHSRTKKVIATNSLVGPIHAPPNASSGVLFVLTKQRLYAIRNVR